MRVGREGSAGALSFPLPFDRLGEFPDCLSAGGVSRIAQGFLGRTTHFANAPGLAPGVYRLLRYSPRRIP